MNKNINMLKILKLGRYLRSALDDIEDFIFEYLNLSNDIERDSIEIWCTSENQVVISLKDEFEDEEEYIDIILFEFKNNSFVLTSYDKNLPFVKGWQDMLMQYVNSRLNFIKPYLTD